MAKIEGSVILDTLFAVARNVTVIDGAEEQLERLRNKAHRQVSEYDTEDGGIKGMWAKAESGWIIPLFIVILAPFGIAWAVNLRDRMMNPDSGRLNRDIDDLDFDDDDIEP